MSEKIVQLNVEETLNELLEKEAEALTQAADLPTFKSCTWQSSPAKAPLTKTACPSNRATPSPALP